MGKLLAPKIGYKSNDYITLKVRSNREVKNGYGKIVCNPGDVYYYHLQYPDVKTAKAHISMLLQNGYYIEQITTVQYTEGKQNYVLPIYLSEKQIEKNIYWKVHHNHTYRHLGLDRSK